MATKKRDAVGYDPLSTLLQNTGAIQMHDASPTPSKERAEDILAAEKPRFTVRIPAGLQERVRNACYWDRITVTEFAERAFEAELARLEQLRGEAYPERTAALKPGRPVKL